MLFRNVLHIKAIERKCHVKTYIVVFKDYPRHFVFVSAICDIEWRVTSSDLEQIFGQKKNSTISRDFSAPGAYFLSDSPHCILTCTKTMDSQLSLSQPAKNLKIKRKGTKTNKKLGYRRVRASAKGAQFHRKALDVTRHSILATNDQLITLPNLLTPSNGTCKRALGGTEKNDGL